MSKRSSKKSGESVAELDDALGTLPDGAADAGAGGADDNPLEQVDVSGTTSFESAEFAAGYDGSKAEDEDRRDAEGEVVIHDADAEDRAEELARRRAGASGEEEGAGGEVAPGGHPRELAE